MLNEKLNKNPFTVPNNYFDHLPLKVQERYSSKEYSRVRFSLWSTILRSKMSYIVASFVMVLITYVGISFLSKGYIVTDFKNGMKHLTSNTPFTKDKQQYTQFTNNQPMIHLTSNKSKQTKMKNDYDDVIMDYLAAENISADDIILELMY